MELHHFLQGAPLQVRLVVMTIILVVLLPWMEKGVQAQKACKENEVFEDPDNCQTFRWCGQNNQYYKFDCADGLFFDSTEKRCDHPQNVDCTGRGGYMLRSSNGSLILRKGVFWGPAIPKDRCKNVYCTVVLRNDPAPGARFTAEDLDPRICSYIIVANFKLDIARSTNVQLSMFSGRPGQSTNETEKQWLVGEIEKLRDISKVYSDVKVLAAIGHFDGPTVLTSALRKGRRARRSFAKNVITFLQKYKLDGIHVHWVVPAEPPGSLARYISYLVKELAEQFDRDEVTNRRPRLIQALSIPADKPNINAGFIPGSIHKVDVAFLMVPSMKTKWTVSGDGESRQATRLPIDGFTVDKAVKKWRDMGLATTKIVLGVALGTNRFSMSTQTVSTEDGFPKPYHETCGRSDTMVRATDMVYGPGYSVLTLSPLSGSVQSIDWTEDKTSLAQKVSFAASYDLGGIHLIDVNNDDIIGRCKQIGRRFVKFPLALAAVKSCTVESDPVTANSTQPVKVTKGKHKYLRTKPGCQSLVCMYRPERFINGKPGTQLHVTDLDPSLCTHLMYASVPIEKGNTTGKDSLIISPTDVMHLEKMKELKDDYESLQVMMVAKDPSKDQDAIHRVANNYAEMKRFILEATSVLRSFDVDGIDIDWYFPKWRNGSGFQQLMQNFSAVFKRESEISGRPRMTFSTSVYGNVMHFYKGLREVSEAVDFIRFDISKQFFIIRKSVPASNVTITERMRAPDVTSALGSLTASKVRTDKVILSLEIEAKVFEYGIHSNVSIKLKRPLSLPITRTLGRGAYYEVCQLRNRPGTQERIFLDEGAHFLTFKDDGKPHLVVFQDETILRLKTGLILKQGFAGGFVKNLAADDFTGGYCRRGVFPLLHSIGEGCEDFKREVRRAPKGIIGKRLAEIPSVGCKRLVCYYYNEARLRLGKGKMSPGDIDPTLCTHLIFSHAKLDNNQIQPMYPDDIGDNGAYAKFVDLKKRNPGVKTLLSLRPPLVGFAFSRLVKSGPAAIQAFSEKAASFVRQHGFDGLDVDWETTGQASPEEKAGLTLLLRTLATTFKSNLGGSKPPLLLTVKVSGLREVLTSLYDLPAISKYADLLLVNTYSWYNWQANTHHYSPIFARQSGVRLESTNTHNTIEDAISYLLGNGAAREKTVLSIGLYARTFILAKPAFSQPGDESSAIGRKGKYTQQFGSLSTYEVCEVGTKGGSIYFIDDQLVPYMVHEDTWIGFENEFSVRQKVRYSKLYGLGGVAVWSVDADDFQGKFCGSSPFPLLKSVNKECSVLGEAAEQLWEARKDEALFKARFEMRRVCFISKDSFSRPEQAKFEIKFVPPGLCSHFILDGLTIEEDGTLSGLEAATLNALRQMKLMKKQDDNLQILFSVKAPTQYHPALGNVSIPGRFRSVASSQDKRKRLFEGLGALLRAQQIYGVDVQWTDFTKNDVSLYMDFITALREDFDKRARVFGTQPKLTLTLGKQVVETMNYAKLSEKVDFVNVLSFGYSKYWINLTHDNLVEDFQRTLNDYVKAGLPKNKTVAGLSLYGKVYYLSDPKKHTAGDPAACSNSLTPDQPNACKGPKSASLKQRGIWPNYEVCYQMKTEDRTARKVTGYNKTRHPLPGVSSLYYNSKIWISYDSRNKLQDKAIWIKNQGFSGYLLYTLDADVFLEGLCGFNVEKFPVAMGVHLASRGMKQFEALVQSSSAQRTGGSSSLLNTGQWLGATRHLSSHNAFVLSVLLGTVYYTFVTMQLRN